MSAFRPACTLPTMSVNYVYPADSRGSLEIIWSCLSILILCLWNVVHINVRAPLYPCQAWSKTWLFGRARIVVLKLQFMLVAFFTPELLIAKALHDRIIVSESVKVMQKFASADAVSWTIAHAHFANMGAFIVSFASLPPSLEVEVTKKTTEAIVSTPDPILDDEVELGHRSSIGQRNLTSTGVAEAVETTRLKGASVTTNEQETVKEHPVSASTPKNMVVTTLIEATDSFGRGLKRISSRYGREVWQRCEVNSALAREALDILNKSGILSIRLRNRQRNALALQGDLWILDATQIHVARSFGNGDDPLLRLPDIHEQHLEAESKSDALLKILTVVQIAWMAIQLVVRLSRRLPTTQLEIMTFAFAICSIITYIALLEKPKDVALTKTIQALRYPTAEELLDIALAGPSTLFRYRPGYWMPGNAIHHLGSSPAMNTLGLTVRQKIEKLDANASYSRGLFILTGCIGAVLFSSLHFISWDFHFPTSIERLIWRIALCFTVAFPLLGAISQGLFAQIFQKRTPRHEKRGEAEQYQKLYLRVTSSIVGVIGILYVVVRLFVLVEVFRSLAYQPPEAYRTTWAVSLPHVG